jgi:ABC-2 type transport system ATP-binding protein
MIELRELTRRFGPYTAVDRVSFAASPGEVLGFLGPNGAGKSTTMKMLTGFLPPTSGTALVKGHDVVRHPIAVKREVGYLPEGAPAYPDMTPESFLRFVAQARGIPRGERARRVGEMADRVRLEGVMRQPIETLSKGYKRRVGLAQALIHDPDVLVLDEPTDGLDPNQKQEVRDLIRGLGREKVIVLSTHILEEVEAVCTRVVLISSGRIIADEPPAQLQARSRAHNAIRLRVAGGVDGLAGELRSIPGVRAIEGDGVEEDWMIYPDRGATIAAAVGERLRARGAEIREFRVERGRLDEVFRALTTGDSGSDEEARA